MARDERWNVELEGTGVADRWNTINGLEEWSEALGRTHVPFSVGASGGLRDGFFAAVREQSLGAMSLIDVVTTPYAGDRTIRDIDATSRDIVAFQYIAAGRQVVRQGDDVLTVCSGDVMVWDSDVRCSYEVLEPLRKQTLVVPRSVAAAVLPSCQSAVVQTMSSARPGSVRSLFALLSALGDGLATMSPEAIGRAGALVVQMLADLGPRVDHDALAGGRRGARELRDQVFGHVEANLGDKTLSPATIAAALFVSTRTLHAALEGGDTTLAAHIRQRRLMRCYADLLAGDDRVGDVAARWGFVNSAHFSRVFVRQYGFPPSRVRPR